MLVGGGLLIFAVGLWGLLRAVLAPFQQRREPLVELIYQKRSLARGPRVVAIGGGTGQSTLLRGLKAYTSNITAVVAWPMTADRRAACATSWASRRWATSATASRPSPTPSRS